MPLLARTWIERSLSICVVVGTLVAVTPLQTASDLGNGSRDKQEIKRAIAFYAKRYKLDPALLRAVIKVESDFRPHVVSRRVPSGSCS